MSDTGYLRGEVGLTVIVLHDEYVYWRHALSESRIYYKDIISVQGYETFINSKISIVTAGRTYVGSGSSRGLTAVINELQKKIEVERIRAKHDSSSNSADEIRKYKQLADEGVITQQEFEAKKKQLLGL